MADPLSAVFHRPFTEQVAAFRLRLGNQVGTATWRDLWQSEHDRAFMVAGAMKADLLSDLGAAVERAITEGTGLEAFRRDFRDIVARNGWHGWTGEGTKKGEAWRTRVIYRTNLATSYASGRYAQLVRGNFKYWIYFHGGSLHPRLHHLAWDGLALPPDHPFWLTHGPPNGWGCSCYIIGARSKAGVRRLGGDPDKQLEAGWNAIEAKTGTPAGIGKGWDYTPGRSVADDIQKMAEKTIKWEHVLAKEFMAELPASLVDDFARSYRQLPSLNDTLRRYTKAVLADRPTAPYATMGRLTSQQVDDLARLQVSARGFDFTIEPDAVRHIWRRHTDVATELARGQRAVTPADIALLPRLLDIPGPLKLGGETTRPGSKAVEYRFELAGEKWVVVFESRNRRRMMVLKTLYIFRGK